MSLLSRLVTMLRPAKLDRDVEDEIRAHLEMRVEANLAAGMTPEDARRDARLRFGNPAVVGEDTRRADIVAFVESVVQDVRYGARMLRKAPVFTAVAVVTLILGIGGNTAIFTLTHALLLRSLPVADPDRLARVTLTRPDMDLGLSGPMFDEIGKRQQVFGGMLAWGGTQFTVMEDGEARYARGAVVSGDAFQTLGVTAALGRVITPAD